MKTKSKITAENISSFRKALLTWYNRNKRDLPFRQTKDPYKIWLSEIMLQQTTVSAVIDYYNRFIAKFPTAVSVAKASENELLSLWQGLGYYSRIRNFKKACEHVASEFGGQVPSTYEGLKKLKGIGDYTAAAVSSIAFGQAHAVVDGNVKRVLARLYFYNGNIAQKSATEFFQNKASELLDPKHAGDFNQAVMELGATVCRPKSPLCLICPVREFCVATDRNPEALPVKSKMNFIEVEYFALLSSNDDQILLKKPKPDNLIANMWELPSIYDASASAPEEWQMIFQKQWKKSELKKIGEVGHGITNKKITTHVYSHPLTRIQNEDYEVVAIKNLGELPVNTLTRKILKKFHRI